MQSYHAIAEEICVRSSHPVFHRFYKDYPY